MTTQQPRPSSPTKNQPLTLSIGQYSHKGRKDINQDFHGSYCPAEPQLSSKGIAIAIADGISSSQVSQIASESAVTSFLQDYYCTSEAWSTKKSAQQVLMATNSWLFAQTQQSQYRYDKDRGYVCTLSALIIKSDTAHIFHIGDTRIYRLHNNALEQLTQDHRLWVSQEQSYLSRGLGINSHLEIDYKALPVAEGDIFILASDGVYEFANDQLITETINAHQQDLNTAAKFIVEAAFDNGSTDNLTAQVVRINTLPSHDTRAIYQQYSELPFPPLLEARAQFDGYTIL
jgi:serine/threonine protein kinase